MTESYEDMRLCPVCNRIRPRSDMLFTHDCHGITFRLVCWECYQKVMAKGYDGEYYTDADEQIEDDYRQKGAGRMKERRDAPDPMKAFRAIALIITQRGEAQVKLKAVRSIQQEKKAG